MIKMKLEDIAKGQIRIGYKMKFPMAKQLGEGVIVDFVRSKTLQKELNAKGFGYDFYPAPFKNDLHFLGFHTARMIENRNE